MIGFRKIFVESAYGEVTLTGGTATPISTADVVHGWIDAASIQDEILGSIEFHSGSTGTITATADNTVLRCTDVGHGLSTGDIITLDGMADAAHDGITKITKIDDDTFDCDNINYNGADAGGSWRHPDHIKILPGGAGRYQAVMTFSMTKEGGAPAMTESGVYVGVNLKHKIIRQIPGTDTGALALSGIVNVNVGDEIWIGINNVTNTDDLTIGEASASIHKV